MDDGLQALWIVAFFALLVLGPVLAVLALAGIPSRREPREGSWRGEVTNVARPGCKGEQ